jgi:hypothetical protein
MTIRVNICCSGVTHTVAVTTVSTVVRDVLTTRVVTVVPGSCDVAVVNEVDVTFKKENALAM